MKKNPLCNEQGVTLIELVTALVLASIVIGVLTMTFMSVNLEWNRSTNKYNDDAQARKTINLLSDTLTDSSEVFATTEEIRFRTGKGSYQALRYEDHQIILYDYEAPALRDPGVYSKPLILATNVQSSPAIQYESNPQYYGMIYGGELFQLQIIFDYSVPDVNGMVQKASKQYTISVKLFK